MIRLSGVTRRFSSDTGARAALDGVDLEIHRGEIFGVVGRSGAGKSTLIRTINLLERPDSGSVRIDDQDLMGLSAAHLRQARRRVGMIFQHFNLLHNRTVRANVAFPLELEGVSTSEVRRRVDALLQRVGLSAHADRYPSQLSGGQKQRVGIARALASEPAALLCDEATSALDPETTEDILSLLDELNRELGLTIVLVTHEMDVVRRVCDRFAVMQAGQVAEVGATADLFLHPQAEATRQLLSEGRAPLSTLPAGVSLVARIVLRGQEVHAPILARAARETGVDFAILTGRVGRFRQEPYGELEVAFSGDGASAALERLKAGGVAVEVLR